MNIDISILYLFVAMSFGIIGIGYLIRFSIPMSLFIFIAGGLMASLFIMTDNIVTAYSVNETGSSLLYSYKVEDSSGLNDICGGAGCTNPVIRGEYVFSTSSQLYGDVIDCIDVTLRKTGSPTGNAIIGIFDHAQADSDPLIKQFGTYDVTLLTTTFSTWFSFCLPVGETYTLGDQDVIGVKYAGGGATDVIRIQTISADVFDGSNTQHTSQGSVSFTWSNFATTDTVARAYLRNTSELQTTEVTSPFSEELKTFMVLMSAILMLVGGMIEINARRN